MDKAGKEVLVCLPSGRSTQKESHVIQNDSKASFPFALFQCQCRPAIHIVDRSEGFPGAFRLFHATIWEDSHQHVQGDSRTVERECSALKRGLMLNIGNRCWNSRMCWHNPDYLRLDGASGRAHIHELIDIRKSEDHEDALHDRLL
jgi:hypothetical protein